MSGIIPLIVGLSEAKARLSFASAQDDAAPFVSSPAMSRIALFFALSVPAALFGQSTPHAEHQPTPALSRTELASFAKLNVALAKVRDSAQHQLGLPEHLNDKSQDSLRSRLKTVIADILQRNGVNEEDY